MSKLAIKGGKKLREKNFPAYVVMGEEEAQAAYDVVKSGILSKFLGCWDPDFFGGEQIQALEKEWAQFFSAKHAITVNSNTSGLICAVGALGIGHGDEVIVSPYSMSASASTPLFYGAVSVFADIEKDYFCIDPDSVEKLITKRTKAILAVDIFGHPYNHNRLNEISKKYNIPVIEDCAQAPYAKFGDKYCGNLGTMGIFSLNYHKHIHSGEGGVILTNDDDLAMRLRLIRNHAEAVVDSMGYKGNPSNLVGFNMRMTEVEAAIARVQLKRLPKLIQERLDNVKYLEEKLKTLDFLTLPKVDKDAVHVYYQHAIKFDAKKAGVHRNTFVDAVCAELPETDLRIGEGPLMGSGYVKPLYLQSLYQNKVGFGEANYPLRTFDHVQKFEKGLCPVTESMHFEELFCHEMIRPGMSKSDLDDVANAFFKVAENMYELKS